MRLNPRTVAKVFCCLVGLPALLLAQGGDTAFVRQRLRTHLDILAAPHMCGRGYVSDGRGRAARYIEKQFREFGLKPIGSKGFRQRYTFPVITFPSVLTLKVNGEMLNPGIDYLVDAGSASYSARHLPVKVVDIAQAKSLATAFGASPAANLWVLRGVDSFCKAHDLRLRSLAEALPTGCFVISQTTKSMWTVSREQHKATVFYVNDTSVPSGGEANVSVSAKLVNLASDNLVACVPGTVPDSFIVFSAHYDHLGMMGRNAVFPGASDNASGTSMLLYLAEYYAAHPQRYTMVFIAFSGEEAGLMGSGWFVKHPVFPLPRIKFLTNLDIMGDATDGITVVNATEHPQQFGTLEAVNRSSGYLPAVKSRGKAANSDHYHFSEAGVPAFFIYTNGGKGYYHDVFDKPGEVTLANIPSLALLLRDFTTKIQER